MIERKRYLELCQMNAVYPDTVVVNYNGAKYHPVSYLMWFDRKGSPNNTAVLHSVGQRVYTQASLADVWEAGNKNDGGEKDESRT